MERFRARVVFAAALIALLCGCAHPNAGNALVFAGLAGEPDTLNPLLSTQADLFNLSHLYLSYLVEADDTGRLVPEIATAVPSQANGGISRDGKTIFYHIRRGVRWQDGASLTARDVVFSARAVLNPANNVGLRVGFDRIERIEARGDDTVVVRLKQPFSPFLSWFFGPLSPSGVLPAHLLARYPNLNRVSYNQRPVGSGPYRVVEWRHGDSVAFAANPSYWRGVPAVAQMTYKIVADPNTRLELLQTGEVDAYFDVDPQLLPQLQAMRGVRVAMTPQNDMHVLRFNLRDPVLADVRVRRAIAMAIDRKQLIAGATHGSGIVVDGDQPVNGWAYDAALAPIPYDPAAARALLDAAGWKRRPDGVRARNGVPLEIAMLVSPQMINGSQLVASVVQEDLRRAGIAVTIKPAPAGSMWAPAAAGGIQASGRYQMSYDAWWITSMDPDDEWNFACDQRPPAGDNFYFWCNARADGAIRAAVSTYDRAQRRADYAIVQQELRRDVPEFTLWQVQMPNAYRERLHGVAPSPGGSIFWNAWRWRLQ